jgi:hypothetical protein
VTLVPAVLLPVLAAAGLRAWRWSDDRRAAAAWKRLVAAGAQEPRRFDPAMVDGLPEPARRYFLYAIRPGTPLRTVAEIRMRGAIGLGDKARPNYRPMRARQLLAPFEGFVWELDSGSGLARVSGSDGLDGDASWVRFWLARAVPVVRAGGGADHRRSAFGRMVAEAVFWTPAALLPAPGVAWEAVGPDLARATVRARGMTQTVDLTVAADGKPETVVIPRWTNANPDTVYRLQPFGGYLSEFREFAGFVLPARVEGGNMFGTDAYFPFYEAEVADLRFLPA